MGDLPTVVSPQGVPRRRAGWLTERMKKLINGANDVVAEALVGIEAAYSDRLRIDHANKVILRKDAPRPGKVGLVSGGGSGHEPMHGGYVGLGMLDEFRIAQTPA